MLYTPERGLKKVIESNFIELISKGPSFLAQFTELSDYELVYKLQEEICQEIQHSKKIVILGCEHNDVITLGRRAENSEIYRNDILPVIRSSRGGLATIHSSGQLVIYPHLNLRAHDLSVRGYVELLLKTTQGLLQLYGVSSEVDLKQVGLYTKLGKIAFCGIQIKDRMTMHGISLNVFNDLELFKLISPCGLANSEMDRLQNHTSRKFELRTLFSQWSSLFQDKLNL